MTPLDEPTEAAAPTYDIDLVPTLLLGTPHPRPPLTGLTRWAPRSYVPSPPRRPPRATGTGRISWSRRPASTGYFLLSLVCSFRPAPDGAPFVDAGIGIRLEAPDEPTDRQPIAWSISPKKRAGLRPEWWTR